MPVRVLGGFDAVAQSAPGTPPAGRGLMWFDAVSKHWKQTDDAGTVTDLAASGSATLSSVDVPFVDGDTYRRVSVVDAGVSSSSKIVITVVRPVGAGTPYATIVGAEANLKAWWRFRDGSGSVATDSKGSNNGAYVGSPVLTGASPLAEGGTSVLLNGTSQYIQIVSPTLTIADDFTLEALVKRTALGGGSQRVFDRNVSNGQQWFENNLLDDHWNAAAQAGGSNLANSAGVPNAGQWYHKAISKNGSATAMYQDGADVTVPNSNTTITGAASDIFIGRHRSSSTEFLNGALAEFAVYVPHISATAIAQHAAQVNGATGDATDYGYLYIANVVSVYSGGFDVVIAATDGFGHPEVAPNETIKIQYMVG